MPLCSYRPLGFHLNGVFAQIMAIVAYGNAYLIDGSEPQELLGSNSTFKHVNSIQFVAIPSPSKNATSFSGTREWYKHLKDSGISRLSLEVSNQDLESHEDGPPPASFVHQIPGSIRANHPSGADSWWPRWNSASESKAAHRSTCKRVWDIVYKSTSARSDALQMADLEDAMLRLRDALNQAKAFSESSSRLKYWTQRFVAAIESSYSDEPEILDYPDLIPRANYSLEARRLLGAGAGAWVFGAMGSWNDVSPGLFRKRRYEIVTGRLYKAMILALVAGINAFERAVPIRTAV
jgi:hypothetical protein